VIFIIIVSGFVVYEILVEWGVSKSILLAFPGKISHGLGIAEPWAGTVKGIILFVVFPFLFFGIFSGIRKILRGEKFIDAAAVLALALLPVMGAMHLLKGLLKTTSRIPYWSMALHDPGGVGTAKALVEGTLRLDKSFLQSLAPFMSGIALLMPVLAFGLSAWLITRRKKDCYHVKAVTLAAVLIYTAIFESMIIAWRLI
jgi:hypothetical protein